MPSESRPRSSFLALVLRHKPETIGLTLDEQGWADVAELIACSHRHGKRLTRELLRELVATNDKQRFVFSPDGQKIRAQQGHSLPIDLNLPPREPPEILYHGTASRFLASIRVQGLLPGRRQHVHLSPDAETAERVGRRHGPPIVLVVRAQRLSAAGQAFYLSGNGVWLTAAVPPEFLEAEWDET